MNSGDGVLVEILRWNDLGRPLMTACMRLHTSVWTNPEPLDALVERRMRSTQDPDTSRISEHRLHLIRQDARVIAMASSFRRSIAVAGTSLVVLALAGVCVDPQERRRGLGEAVVRSAWARLDATAPVSLFQTAVPAFYERMGARCIANHITCSGRTFWEPHAMIAPGNSPWPAGTIDLLGDGW